MAKVFMKVRAVEGHQVVDPRTIGVVGVHRRIGYKAVTVGKVVALGVDRDDVKYELDVDTDGRAPEVVVPETTDHYLRRAILDGSLDYIETIHDYVEPAEGGKPAGKAFKTLDLVEATTKNQRERAAIAKAAAEAEKKAADADAAKIDKLLKEQADLAKGDAPEAKPAKSVDVAGPATR